MGVLLVLSCALIIYGTLYPFGFNFGLHEESVFILLAESARDHASRGDIIANIILFLPFGFFAMQSVLSRVPRPIRLIIVIIAGTAFSIGIECTQSYLPSRVVSIYDIAANTIGTLLGAAFGWKNWRIKLSGFRADGHQHAVFPVLLLCAWLGSQLFPFVPTLDVQNAKDALKPLFFGEFLPLNALNSFIVTLIVCQLAQTLALPGRFRTVLTLLPLAVIAVKPFILGGTISQAKILGTLLGLSVWRYILSRIRRNTGILALLLTAQIVIQGLSPFVFNSNRGNFSFIPFTGFMHGSMLINVLSFIEKGFLYGALIWLLVKIGLRLRFSMILSVALLTGIEIMQMFQPGRVSEITDPILVIILGFFLYFTEKAEPGTA